MPTSYSLFSGKREETISENIINQLMKITANEHLQRNFLHAYRNYFSTLVIEKKPELKNKSARELIESQQIMRNFLRVKENSQQYILLIITICLDKIQDSLVLSGFNDILSRTAYTEEIINKHIMNIGDKAFDMYLASEKAKKAGDTKLAADYWSKWEQYSYHRERARAWESILDKVVDIQNQLTKPENVRVNYVDELPASVFS